MTRSGPSETRDANDEGLPIMAKGRSKSMPPIYVAVFVLLQLDVIICRHEGVIGLLVTSVRR